MWVTMPSASLLLGQRTKPVPFIRSVPFLTGAFILPPGAAAPSARRWVNFLS
jgi:hypothetical protein